MYVLEKERKRALYKGKKKKRKKRKERKERKEKINKKTTNKEKSIEQIHKQTK